MTQQQLAAMRDKHSTLQKLYNQLLEKNQNDLIWIKQKQRALEASLASLQADKQAIRNKLTQQINTLALELQKMKSQKTIPPAEDPNNLLRYQMESTKQQNVHLMTLLKNKQERVEELQQSVRKLMDENIEITKVKNNLNAQHQKQNQKHNLVMIELEQFREREKVVKEKGIPKQIQTQTANRFIQEKQVQQLSTRIKLLQQEHSEAYKQIDKFKQNQMANERKIKNIMEKLKQTNDELKRYMERDKKTSLLLRKKQEEVDNLQTQLERLQKIHKPERHRQPTEQNMGCMKCKQWQQENQLLKQMIKSVQTMVRVREIEAERYKAKQQNIGTPKTEERQKTKDNKSHQAKFPPLKKQ